MLEQDESNIILNQVTFSDITALCNDSVFKELVQMAEDHCNSLLYLIDHKLRLNSSKMRLTCQNLLQFSSVQFSRSVVSGSL